MLVSLEIVAVLQIVQVVKLVLIMFALQAVALLHQVVGLLHVVPVPMEI